jgi:hypothetical protein
VFPRSSSLTGSVQSWPYVCAAAEPCDNLFAASGKNSFEAVRGVEFKRSIRGRRVAGDGLR